MNGSLDTSVLVQLITAQTPTLAERAIRLVEESPQQLAVADGALIELIFVLEKLKKLSRSAIAVVIHSLSGQEKLNFNRVLFNRAMPLYCKQPQLSIQDCCLAVYAELNQATPLWTFDKKLASQTASAQLLT